MKQRRALVPSGRCSMRPSTAHGGRIPLFARCLRSHNVRSRVTPVENSVDRLVLVSVSRLDDLLELSRLAIERLPNPDPLTFALRAAIAQVRTEAILEP